MHNVRVLTDADFIAVIKSVFRRPNLSDLIVLHHLPTQPVLHVLLSRDFALRFTYDADNNVTVVPFVTLLPGVAPVPPVWDVADAQRVIDAFNLMTLRHCDVQGRAS